MKKLISILITVAILAALFSVMTFSSLAANHSGTWGNLTWTLNGETGELVISGEGEMSNFPQFSIYAWRNYTYQIKQVTIEEGITSIGAFAFWACHTLTSITIPESVTTVGDGAFNGCGSLTNVYINNLAAWCSINFEGAESNPLEFAENLYLNNDLVTNELVIPDSVTSIGDRAFSGFGSLTSVTVPDSVETIGKRAFAGCIGLISVNIGNGVTSIKEEAFNSCINLRSVSLGSGITSIEHYAFLECNKIVEVINHSELVMTKGSDNHGSIALRALEVHTGESKIDNKDGYPFYTYNDVHYLLGYSGAETELVLPNGYNGEKYEIREYAFSDCKDLTSITISDSVTSIGRYAFENCSDLISVTIGSGVTSIGHYAFAGCNSLTNAYISNLAAWCSINFKNAEANPLKYAGNLCLNNDLVTNELIIPDNVTSIGGYAFYGCSSLTSVTIPNSVTSISGSAFYGCSGLMSITIPDSVTSIGGQAFYGCSSLISVTIGSGVATIGYSAFDDCKKLVEIINHSQYPDSDFYNKDVHDGESKIVNKNGYLFYTYDSINYLLGYSGAETELVLPNGYNGEKYEIREYAFSDCKDLTSITISDSVTSIGRYAFENCSDLISVTIGSGVTSIGISSFSGCNSLTSVTIPDSVTSIGGTAFYCCSSLTSITIPDSVTSIGNSAFYGCDSLIQKENGLHYVDKWIIDCDYSVTSAVLRNDTKSIANSAFDSCANLTSINIPDSVTSIGESAFRKCTNLTSINIPDSVTSIANSAFDSCANLTSINIPDSVTSIGQSAFYYCTSLTSINIPDSVTKIKDHTFGHCRSLTSINIPSSVTSIGLYAFSDCTALSGVYITDIASWCNLDFSAFSVNPLYYAHNLYINNELVTDLVIPNSVEYIGDESFDGCTSITRLTISNNVKNIGSGAFRTCSNLKDVTYCGSESEWETISYKFPANISVSYHKYGNKELTTPPTHISEGVNTAICSFCRAEKTESVDKLTNHNHNIYEPETSSQHKILCECGDFKYENHSWNSWNITTEPTYDREGVKTYTCKCGETKTETIPKMHIPPSNTDNESIGPSTSTDNTTHSNADKSTNSTKANSSNQGKSNGCSSTLTLGTGFAAFVASIAVLMVCKKNED